MDLRVGIQFHRRPVQLVVGVVELFGENDLLRDLVLGGHDAEPQHIAGLQFDGRRHGPEDQLAQRRLRIERVGDADARAAALERGAQVDLLAVRVDDLCRNLADIHVEVAGQQFLIVPLAGDDGQRDRFDLLVGRQLLVRNGERVFRHSHRTDKLIAVYLEGLVHAQFVAAFDLFRGNPLGCYQEIAVTVERGDIAVILLGLQPKFQFFRRFSAIAENFVRNDTGHQERYALFVQVGIVVLAQRDMDSVGLGHSGQPVTYAVDAECEFLVLAPFDVTELFVPIGAGAVVGEGFDLLPGNDDHVDGFLPGGYDVVRGVFRAAREQQCGNGRESE